MAAHKFSLELIEDFLAQERVAMIGVSREPKHFSVILFEELCRRGYDVIPVNPNAPSINGHRCFAKVQDIQPPVKAALLMTSPSITDAIVHDCHAAGITQVWMYRAAGQGAVSPEAVAYCEAKGMDVIPGQCPFMFLPGSGGIHRFHGLIRKITGRYPRHRAAA
ncbi:MAG TPA: CoA-binding protein [Candidatus Sulfotelmatobacter sp.]|nr:CoA-binding protein [Candidatus Sulfotelmatobacter sp.]